MMITLPYCGLLKETAIFSQSFVQFAQAFRSKTTMTLLQGKTVKQADLLVRGQSDL